MTGQGAYEQAYARWQADPLGFWAEAARAFSDDRAA